MLTSSQEKKNLFNPQNQETHLSQQIQPLLLEWKNLEYTVKSASGDLNILKNVSGFSNPGELLAIMGPSGCGKTSLLSILAQNLTASSGYLLSGEVTYNNVDVSAINPSLFVRYVSQDNILFDFLTSYETLKFEASLKINAPEEDIEKHIENTLKQFELTNVQHTIIGNSMFKGLSGGEKRRLAIAVELITSPSLIILDEPTSGLDSHMARNMIDILHNLKRSGVNVVFSIHQPSSAMFQKFDRLILMQDGNFVYQGKASSSLSYFRDIGFHIESHVNPPEFYMKMLAVTDRKNLSAEESERKNKLNEAYQKQKDLIWNEKEYLLHEEGTLTDKSYHAGVFKALQLLLWRNFLSLKRNTLLLKSKMVQPIIFGILIDLIFHNLSDDNKGVENRNGVIVYFIIANFTVPGMSYAIITAYEKSLSTKEIHDGNYPLISYYLSKFIIELPLFAVSSLLITLIVYFVVGLNLETWDKIFIFYAVGFTFQVAGMCFGCLIGSVADSVLIALRIAPSFIVVFLLFSGMFTSFKATPGIFKSIKYITPIYYGKMALMKNEFDDLDLDDDVNPKPEDRYDYDRPIYLNEIYLICVLSSYLFISYLIGAIRLYRKK